MSKELITGKREAALALMLEGDSMTVAAGKAGISTPARDLMPVIMSPQVRQHFFKHVRGRLEAEAAPAAYKLLYRTMTDESKDLRLRVDIAKFMLPIAGYQPPKAAEARPDDVAEKEPSQMTTEELKRMIEDGEAVLASRAKPANGAQGIDSLM